MNKPKIIAIIPARGGSKGVPRKNIRMVAGKPLLAWTITAALQSKTIDTVIVSTDDDEISCIAKHYGAEVIRRPTEISGDTASSESALLHVLNTLKERNIDPELTVFLQATSPLTIAEDIDNCVARLEEMKADTAFTAKDFFYFIWKEEKDGSCDGINHDKKFRPRRQDRKPQYEENGAVYVMRTKGFLEKKHRFFGKTVLSLMPESRCFEIDTEFDLKIADRILREKDNNVIKSSKQIPSPISAIIFDFDGVMTDDHVWIDQEGKEMVCCSREDGQGINRARFWNIPLLILSSEINSVVEKRAQKLKTEIIHGMGIYNKLEALEQWSKQKRIDLKQAVYIGNDLNDIDCMERVGYSFAPQNANPAVKDIADYVLHKQGGYGAVRECLDIIERSLNTKQR